MVETRPRTDLERWLRRLSAGVTVGLVTGLVVGGVGGRLAMFLLRLTSDPSLHGVKTDDDFTIGVMSGATFFLLVFAAAVGVLAGLAYLVVRTWLPLRWRPWLAGAFAGLVGGALIVRPDGVDFSLLGPLPLAIAMFIAIPAGYGAVISVAVERRFARPDDAAGTSAAWIAGLLPLVFLPFGGGLGIAIILILVAAGAVAHSVPAAGVVWRSRPVVWIGRAAMAAIAGVAGVALVGDITEIL